MNIKTPELTDLPALQSLWQEAFGDTLEFIHTFFQTAFDCQRCFCVVDKGIIVAALYWFDCSYQDKPVAYLYAISTAKAYQGQGICHKLMTHTHDYLREIGYTGAILVPGSTALFDFYKGMGYETCCFVNEFCYDNATEEHPTSPVVETAKVPQKPSLITKATHAPLQLCTITATEYAAFRRQLLPKDGIIQENICLTFLQTQARLYAGPHFIMAAHVENNKLFVPELLGDTSTMPQILSTLGCEKGIFRTPGTKKPFAMYLPLQKSTLPFPTYFGLAFD